MNLASTAGTGIMFLGLCAMGVYDKTIITIDNNEFRNGTGIRYIHTLYLSYHSSLI